MKKQFSIYLILLSIVMFSSCQDEELSTPAASFTASSVVLKINESVEFKFNGTAQKVSIFTGDDEHLFDSIQSGNTGFVMNKGLFNYAYRYPGHYKVVVVASNFNDNAEQLLMDTTSIYINVVDSDATIKYVSCPKVFYDEIAAENINNDWLIRLPQKILFKNQNLTVASKQKLSVKLGSDSAQLYVNDVAFSATTSYELKNGVQFKVEPYSGEANIYNMYMLYYPEFKTFTINGVAGVLTRNEYNYNKMTMIVALPVGTDVTALIPEFTLSEGQNVTVSGVEQTSAVSALDFTNTVNFELTNTSTTIPALSAKTVVSVTVTH